MDMDEMHVRHLAMLNGVVGALRGLVDSSPMAAALRMPVQLLQKQHDDAVAAYEQIIANRPPPPPPEPQEHDPAEPVPGDTGIVPPAAEPAVVPPAAEPAVVPPAE